MTHDPNDPRDRDPNLGAEPDPDGNAISPLPGEPGIPDVAARQRTSMSKKGLLAVALLVGSLVAVATEAWMVSVLANVVIGAATPMSGLVALPSVRPVTLAVAGIGAGGGVGAGAGAGVGAGAGAASSRWQPARTKVTSSTPPASSRIGVGFIVDASVGRGSAAGIGDLEDLAGLDPVRVVELVAVGLEDRAPASRVAVVALADAGERVARGDRVGAHVGGGGGERRFARSRVGGEGGLEPVVLLREQRVGALHLLEERADGGEVAGGRAAGTLQRAGCARRLPILPGSRLDPPT